MGTLGVDGVESAGTVDAVAFRLAGVLGGSGASATGAEAASAAGCAGFVSSAGRAADCAGGFVATGFAGGFAVGLVTTDFVTAGVSCTIDGDGAVSSPHPAIRMVVSVIAKMCLIVAGYCAIDPFDGYPSSDR